ncbi:hypothetical protein DFH11DRAFT_1631031 [Phellopilus nigrolimitatus]|nr:hypothetical protein DFH11DRAFT_1631031 [Phellopilus nigrolimitatus]
MFCSDANRFALPYSPSTCALDASITPMPSILLLAFFLIYVPLKLRARRTLVVPSPYSAYKYGPPQDANAARATWNKKWVHYTYLALAVCLLALRVLEVARLVAARMGVALLPIGLVANVLAIAMLSYGGLGLGMGRARSLEISISLTAYWALSTILEAVKVARLVIYEQLNPAKGTAYPSSDWLLDNGCMLGLLVVFLLVEGAYSALLWRSTVLAEAGRGGALREMQISKPKLVPELFV